MDRVRRGHSTRRRGVSGSDAHNKAAAAARGQDPECVQLDDEESKVHFGIRARRDERHALRLLLASMLQIGRAHV